MSALQLNNIFTITMGFAAIGMSVTSSQSPPQLDSQCSTSESVLSISE